MHQAASQPRIALCVDPDDVALPPQIQRDVVRIAQEAVTNALTHAAASAIDVSCSVGARGGMLEVRDDGRGFDPSGVDAGEAGRFGLLGMAERAARFAGTLQVDSGPGAGTRVRVRWGPAPASAPERPR